MAYEMKDNSGSLFKQPPEKMTKDTSPPYEGEFKIICPHCAAESRGWCKAWVREGKLGKFFSLAFKFRERQPDRQTADSRPAVEAVKDHLAHKARQEQQHLAPRRANGDDEIPF
jgi:hypothetical protein